ncbi:MAG: hypothetical protein NTU53_20305 [Planctomycetota bacterium]|nr:hypothetical protein [Planctomycetota bacterium]
MFRTMTLGLVLGMLLTVAGSALGASPNVQAKMALGRTIPAISFTNVPLRDAIDFLREISGVNVQVHWKALEQAGVTPDTMVNMRLRQVPLRKVLTLLLTEVAGGPTLTYYIDDGVIEVTTREMADGQMFTKVYWVQDLLAEPPEFVVPDFMLGNEGGGGNGGGRTRGAGGNGDAGRYRSEGGANGNGNNLFPAGGNTSNRDKNAKAKELVDMIKEIVQPKVWKDTSGGKASIQWFNGSLVVTASRSVHEEIGGPID